MFPLSTVLLPGELLPLHIFEPRYQAMVADCLEHDPHEFGVVLIARGSEVGGGDVRTDAGTVARIEALSRAADGRYALLARGTTRLRVEQWLDDHPYPRAAIRLVEEATASDLGPTVVDRALHAAEAAVLRVEALLSEMGANESPDHGGLPIIDTEHGQGRGAGPDDSWALCRRLPLGPLDRQRLLTADSAVDRLSILTELAVAMADDLFRLLGQG